MGVLSGVSKIEKSYFCFCFAAFECCNQGRNAAVAHLSGAYGRAGDQNADLAARRGNRYGVERLQFDCSGNFWRQNRFVEKERRGNAVDAQSARRKNLEPWWHSGVLAVAREKKRSGHAHSWTRLGEKLFGGVVA